MNSSSTERRTVSDASTHWRLMFPTEYLAAPEFKGKDVTLTVKSISVEDLPLAGTSDKERRPVVRFAETPKKWVLNKTCAKVLARLYGNETASWVGKRVTLYPTTTKFGRETVDCIRVRDKAPAAKAEASP